MFSYQLQGLNWMLTASEISKHLAERAEAVCRFFLPNGRRAGRYWQVGNIRGDAGRSLCVNLDRSFGERQGRWVDYATGEYGDLLDITAAHTGTGDFRAVLILAQRFLGHADPSIQPTQNSTTPPEHRSQVAREKAAASLFMSGKLLGGTLAHVYLRNRHIDRFGTALRFHPGAFVMDEIGRVQPRPALLAAITDDAGRTTGCARTWLNPDTAAVAPMIAPKRILGRLGGNAVRISELPLSCEQIVGEGLESVLSVGTALPDVDIAACLTATNLAVYQPPSRVKRLWVAHDNDKAGDRALATLKARAETASFRVFALPPLRNDHNDDLRAFGKDIMAARLKHIIRSQVADAFPDLF